MNSPSIEIVLAKLAAHFKTLRALVQRPSGRYYDPSVVQPIFGAVSEQLGHLRALRPDLFDDVPARPTPPSSGTTDYDGRGYIVRHPMEELIRDLDYVFEVRSGVQANAVARPSRLDRVFISHGRSADWREVQPFIDRDVGVQTLELAQQPNRGRTVLQKLNEEAERCSYAVIVMTGDDEGTDDAPRARENVIHEIGFFQGRYGLSSVCLMYEEGTNIPSNIHGLVYVPYPKGLISAGFATLQRELNDYFGH